MESTKRQLGRRLPGYDYSVSPEEEKRNERNRKRTAEKWRKRAHVMAYELLQKGQIVGGEERYARFMETISNKEFSASDIDREIGILKNEYTHFIRYPHMASKPYRPL